MSQDERLMILQMVADGKITASEAVELLKALEGGEPGEPPPPPPPPPPRDEEPRSRPYTSGSGLAAGLSAFIEEIAERVTGVFSDLTGPRHEFPTEVSGLFTADEIPLRIFIGSGHVELKGWDEPGFKAQIVVKLRGASAEEARRRAQEAYRLTADEERFELESDRWFDWSDLSVNLTLYLPRGKRYRLETRTGNGHLDIDSVDLVYGSGRSGNGRIRFAGGAADRLYLKSGNGSVEVDGDVADLEVTTGNGSVTAVPRGQREESLQLKTGNGSIRIDTSRISPDAGLMIDASTGMGGISLSRGDLVYERDDRNLGHKHVICRTADSQRTGPLVVIRARAGLGSISVE